jgi:hypothetical protein
MAYLGTKPANQVIDSTLIADGTVTPSDLSIGKPYWDTSGNLGVGIASPTNYTNYRNIEVRGVTTDKGGVVTVATSDASVSGLLFTDLNSGLVLQTNTNHPISFRTNGPTARMTIDSSGRVTKPYQPAFYAQAASGTNTNPGSGQTMPFNFVHFNIGGHYNVSNYRFTAPIDGIYAFGTQMLGDAGPNGRAIAFIRINGSLNYQGAQPIELSATTKDYNDIQGNCLFSLSANDYVDIRTDGGSEGSRFYGSSSGQNIFYGYLVS